MLSIAKVKDSGAAASYYAEIDNYYTSDQAPSAWFGDGARRLGLGGEVDADTFRQLLDGHMPDDSKIQNAAEGHRAATDLTFSAPKSVSVQALVGGDSRLVAAHERAVERTLAYVESLAAYRVTENHETRIEASGNLLVARFRHDLSREADPQLHTHAVLLNATQRADGQWRALEPGEIYRQKMLLGALYRSELALEVQALGYELRTTHADGRFELAGHTQAQVDAFSQRSAAVEAALARDGLTRATASAAQKERATLQTRQRKAEVDRDLLREQWQAQARELGLDLGRPTATLATEPLTTGAQAAVTAAIAHTTEREAVVSEAQLLRAALEHGTGTTNLAAIRAELAQRVTSGELIQVGERYTTHAAQERERELLAVEVRGRAAVTPILTTNVVQAHLATTTLNPGQRAAVELIATTEHRFVAVQGAAGTGKTVMLQEAQRLANEAGYTVLGLAPSAGAVKALRGAGIDGATLAAFLAKDQAPLTTRTLVALDETGMVSAKDLHALLHTIERAGARAVLVGDTQQLKAVEAGRPFAQLQEAGIARVELADIQRQRDAELKTAVELAARGEVAASLAQIAPRIREIDGNAERYAVIASDYAALSLQARERTLIVAGTHAARAAINAAVRTELGFGGQGLRLTTLERKDLTTTQACMSVSYQHGDIVRADKRYDGLGLRRGELATVVATAPGRVTLERRDGERVEWRPAVQTHLIAFHAQEREFAAGERVRVTSNDYRLGLINGELATVRALDVERSELTLEKADGQRVTLDAAQPLPLDHGYCTTIHASQGQTVERVLIEADTRSVTANESAYYVAISRARDAVSIYTDDKQLLPEAMSRADQKSAALDVRPERTAAVELDR
jgi:conjugative relaxase-like TrwC/TraI family protein